MKGSVSLKVSMNIEQINNGTPLTGSAKRATLSSTTVTRASKSAAEISMEDEALQSSAMCSKFESLLLNLEMCLLYNVWLETRHVRVIIFLLHDND